MTQTRLGSLIEAWSNTFIGYWLNVVLGLAIYPLFGASFSFTQNLGIGAVFTVISVARGYAVRRWFNSRASRRRQGLVWSRLDGASTAKPDALIHPPRTDSGHSIL